MVTNTAKHPPGSGSEQLSFDDVVAERTTPLSEVTFVIVDLETTGGNREHDAITEIGAVKVRGGEVLGEFATLVNPGRDIPPAVVTITGITEAMVVDAPRLDSVLPAFLEFCAHSVLVAHNAPFDVGFLRAGCEKLDLRWPKPSVVCTAKLARRVLTRDETPNHKLATLARTLRTENQPEHRALADARATVDVLHALGERLGSLGVRSLEHLLDFLPGVTPQQRRRRQWAEALPNSPGVYLFRGPNDEVLYVGTATDLRRRVRQYFTAGERRARVKEMVVLSERVEHVECAHPLEAEVRESRLLAAHRPRYNQRSKSPNRTWWLALTEEAFPRLSIVRRPKPEALGPFHSYRAAVQAMDTLHSTTTLRRCTDQIPASRQSGQPCALLELGRCGAPCAGYQSTQDYQPQVVSVRDVVAGRDDTLLDRARAEIDRLAYQHRFEDAATHRDQLAHLVRHLDRGQRLSSLARIAELVAAKPDGHGGWHLAIIRHGRLAAAGAAARGVAPMPVIHALAASAETVLPEAGPLRGGSPDELRIVYAWLTTEGTRLVQCSEPWFERFASAGAWRGWLDRATSARTPYAGAD